MAECKACSGTGTKDGAACPDCKGNGVLGVNLVPAVATEVVKEIPAPKVKEIPSYYPERWIKTMSRHTLEQWREELEQKREVLQAEIDKIDGGLLQLQSEFESRHQAKP